MAFFFISYGLSFFGFGGTNLCVSTIPNMLAPTSEPFTVSNALHDLTLNEGEYPCLKNDPSAQVAFSLQHAVPVMGGLLLIFFLYLIACTTVFVVTKKAPQGKKQK